MKRAVAAAQAHTDGGAALARLAVALGGAWIAAMGWMAFDVLR